ncbi:MAG: hypothetical protein IT204_09480 [Fimbriimonadaceae bacterium]|nr:hypothetical protein [Fimbriimonadaceae bacterium]
MKRAFWIGTWVVAILALSQVIEAGKTWREASGLLFVVETIGWCVALLGAVGLLTLRTYARERAKGNVQRPVALFERILERGADGE